jgi:hypothetical protein
MRSSFINALKSIPEEPAVAYEGKGFAERFIILTVSLSTKANVIIEINESVIRYKADC